MSWLLRTVWRGYALFYERIWTQPLGLTLADAVETFADAGGRVVDVGAGTGIVGVRLARAGHQVLCLDSSRAMLGRTPIHSGLTISVGHANHLPLRSGCADTVVATNLLHLHRDPDLVLDEMARIRAPFGRIICSWPSRDAGPWAVAAAERRLGLSTPAVAVRTALRLTIGLAGAAAGARRTPVAQIQRAVLEVAARRGLDVQWWDLHDAVQTLVVMRPHDPRCLLDLGTIADFSSSNSEQPPGWRQKDEALHPSHGTDSIVPGRDIRMRDAGHLKPSTG